MKPKRRMAKSPTDKSLTGIRKHSGVLVRLLPEQVGKQSRGDHAERDAIAAIAEREHRPLMARRRANIGQAVLGLGECARPAMFWLKMNARKESLKAPRKTFRLRDYQASLLMVVGNGRILAANQSSPVLRLAGIKIRPRRLPDQASIGPVGQVAQWLAGGGIRRVQLAWTAGEEFVRRITSRKNRHAGDELAARSH